MSPSLNPRSDNQSFGATFAAARASKGPGQTFQYKGKSYSTNRADDCAPPAATAGRSGVSGAPRSPDDSSFGTAFATARASKGPGQTFQFKGKSYSTDRADDKPSSELHCKSCTVDTAAAKEVALVRVAARNPDHVATKIVEETIVKGSKREVAAKTSQVTVPFSPGFKTQAGSDGEAPNKSRSAGASYDRQVEIREMIERHEGNEVNVYEDKVLKKVDGKEVSVIIPTAGIGHKLTTSENEKYKRHAEVPKEVRDNWFEQDSKRAVDYAAAKASSNGGAYTFPDVELVMIDMSFQLGNQGCDNFKKMHECIKAGDLDKAADMMLDSKYARVQAPNRAKENAAKLRKAKAKS